MHSSGTVPQISVDVAWSPYGIDGRNYDIQGLAAAADLLFLMAYDMQSQVWQAHPRADTGCAFH